MTDSQDTPSADSPKYVGVPSPPTDGWWKWLGSRVVLFPLLATACLAGGWGLSRLAAHASDVRDAPAAVLPPRASGTDETTRTEIPLPFNMPGFRFNDQSGREVSLQSLQGRPWIAAFIYSSCGSTCTIVSNRMGRLQDILSPQGTQLVTFCVDSFPIDANLQRSFARTLKAEAQHWSVLAGDPAELHALAVAVHALPGRRADDWETAVPHPWLYLVDSKGHVSGVEDALSPDAAATVAKHLAALERAERTGPALPPN